MKVKRDYERIIDEIALIDNRIMFQIINEVFNGITLAQIFNDIKKPVPHFIASIIMLRPKKIDYKDLLRKVIEHNNASLYDLYPATITVEELEAKIDNFKFSYDYQTEMVYHSVLLKFFSENIFHNKIVDHIRAKCCEYIDKRKAEFKHIPGVDKLHCVELSEKLKDTQTEGLFNAMMFEIGDCSDKFPDERILNISEKFLCNYDAEQKVFHDVKRGILMFLMYNIEELFDNKAVLEDCYESVALDISKLKKERHGIGIVRKAYYADKDKILKLRAANKSLKKENKRLNDRVLKKIDKSSQTDLESKVHLLQKDNNYHLSRIEKLEEQVAILEEEKKLNEKLADNISIEELPKKKTAEKPEYQNIVVMGGRWTSNNRKEVLEYLPTNDIDFIDADKTLRYFDKIANSDIIFYDTSYNGHDYYYKAKKCSAAFYHINRSNALEFKKIFEG
jgi:hypothetical protein